MMREYLQDKLIILDNILSSEDCDQLIEYHKTEGHTKKWDGCYPRSIHPDDTFAIPKINKVVSAINSLFEVKVCIDWCEIVRWPRGSSKTPHFDFASDRTALASITYLNDDYAGGATFIENDLKCIPKKGRSFYFDGQYYHHGVEKVRKKDRYTIAIWYILDNAS